MIDGVHDDFVWIDFVQYLIGKRLNERATDSAIDSRIHFRMPLDRLEALVYTPKKLVSQNVGLQIVPRDCVIGILLSLRC